MAMKDTRTKDGFEVQMQTNHLSHVLLTKLLMSTLEMAAESRGESRVAWHSSIARDAPACELQGDFFEVSKPGTLGGDTSSVMIEMLGLSGGPWTRYHMSKLANACYALALHERLQERRSDVKCLIADPGLAASELLPSAKKTGGVPDWLVGLVQAQQQSCGDGAVQLLTACFGDTAESGDLFRPLHRTAGPPSKSLSAGLPLKAGTETLCCSHLNKQLAWDASHAAFGWSDFFAD
eukprot:TRINITY_DN32636_c0_g2_i1.p1 TRINITY_DN32636_c0_g2~~TRINITY_DN32636_c0_g2_i1.p1  ORF type:complete len:236 (-),score=56.52 TRINITY_DN32636_c0_g2_i1:145-852(-)